MSSSLKFLCDICALKFGSDMELVEHLCSLPHQIKAQRQNERSKRECKICYASYDTLAEFSRHIDSETHKTALARFRASKSLVRSNSSNFPPYEGDQSTTTSSASSTLSRPPIADAQPTTTSSGGGSRMIGARAAPYSNQPRAMNPPPLLPPPSTSSYSYSDRNNSVNNYHNAVNFRRPPPSDVGSRQPQWRKDAPPQMPPWLPPAFPHAVRFNRNNNGNANSNDTTDYANDSFTGFITPFQNHSVGYPPKPPADIAHSMPPPPPHRPFGQPYFPTHSSSTPSNVPYQPPAINRRVIVQNTTSSIVPDVPINVRNLGQSGRYAQSSKFVQQQRRVDQQRHRAEAWSKERHWRRPRWDLREPVNVVDRMDPLINSTGSVNPSAASTSAGCSLNSQFQKIRLQISNDSAATDGRQSRMEQEPTQSPSLPGTSTQQPSVAETSDQTAPITKSSGKKKRKKSPDSIDGSPEKNASNGSSSGKKKKKKKSAKPPQNEPSSSKKKKKSAKSSQDQPSSIDEEEMQAKKERRARKLARRKERRASLIVQPSNGEENSNSFADIPSVSATNQEKPAPDSTTSSEATSMPPIKRKSTGVPISPAAFIKSMRLKAINQQRNSDRLLADRLIRYRLVQTAAGSTEAAAITTTSDQCTVAAAPPPAPSATTAPASGNTNGTGTGTQPGAMSDAIRARFRNLYRLSTNNNNVNCNNMNNNSNSNNNGEPSTSPAISSTTLLSPEVQTVDSSETAATTSGLPCVPKAEPDAPKQEAIATGSSPSSVKSAALQQLFEICKQEEQMRAEKSQLDGEMERVRAEMLRVWHRLRELEGHEKECAERKRVLLANLQEKEQN